MIKASLYKNIYMMTPIKIIEVGNPGKILREIPGRSNLQSAARVGYYAYKTARQGLLFISSTNTV